MHLTQIQLGAKAGVDQTAVSKLELGQSKQPEATTLLRLAKALEANPAWILTGKGDPFAVNALPIEIQERILRDFSKLDEEARAVFLSLLQVMANRTE
jgi:transcriptional regulator with XRE-family HTH domain